MHGTTLQATHPRQRGPVLDVSILRGLDDGLPRLTAAALPATSRATILVAVTNASPFAASVRISRDPRTYRNPASSKSPGEPRLTGFLKRSGWIRRHRTGCQPAPRCAHRPCVPCGTVRPSYVSVVPAGCLSISHRLPWPTTVVAGISRRTSGVSITVLIFPAIKPDTDR